MNWRIVLARLNHPAAYSTGHRTMIPPPFEQDSSKAKLYPTAHVAAMELVEITKNGFPQTLSDAMFIIQQV
jgi:hypothetical protein